MRDKFKIPIGYSDNGESTLVDLIAVSLGANIIEKHFTLDKKMKGPDHSFSIEPSSLKKLISEIKVISLIRGNGIKIIQESEKKIQPIIRKSITSRIEIKNGEILDTAKISIKRPAGGIEPVNYNKILGKKVNKDIPKDNAIFWEDLN